MFHYTFAPHFGFLPSGAGVGLSGGSISEVSHTSTTVSLSNSLSASGGTGTITYQWRRKTGAGAYGDVPGATSETLLDVGLSPSTPYTYKRVASDSLTSSDSNEWLVTTSAAVSGLLGLTISYADSLSTIPVYDLGDTVRIIATIMDEITDALATPETIILRLKNPAGTVTTNTTIINDSTGVYHADIVASAAGSWRFRWEATGVSEDGQFLVKSSLAD